MNDLIDRQAAINLFPNDALEWDTNCGYIAPHFARQMIEELPSAQPKIIRYKERRMNWIPRIEREPDTGGHILITVLWEKGVDTAFDNDYEVMEEDWRVGEYEIKEGTATPLVKRIHERMIAWMPMPKPYMRKEE